MVTNEYKLPNWIRSRTAKIAGIAVVAFLIGMGAGGGGEDPSAFTSMASTPTSTITLPGPTVTVDGPARTVEVAGPTVTVIQTKRVSVTKTVRVTARAAEPAPFVDKPDEPADVYYANCSEARAAGDTPLYRGDPGYASHLDRDNDGVACES